jgi:hypothetical protein
MRDNPDYQKAYRFYTGIDLWESLVVALVIVGWAFLIMAQVYDVPPMGLTSLFLLIFSLIIVAFRYNISITEKK